MRLGCHYCGANATTKDHIVPKALDGVDASYNLVPSCAPCNRTKADRMPTCGCAKCVAALVLPRRSDGATAISRAQQRVNGARPARRRQRRRRKRRTWEVTAEGWPQ